MIGLRSRLAVALLVFGLCLVYALPSVPFVGQALENVLPSKKINLGLDLKGGIHLTLGVDVAKAVSNSLALAGQDIRRLAKDEKVVVLHPRVVGNDKLEFALPRAEDEPKLQEILQKYFPQLDVSEPRRTEAGLRYVAEFRAVLGLPARASGGTGRALAPGLEELAPSRGDLLAPQRGRAGDGALAGA